MNFADFHFLRPLTLLLLVPFVYLCWRLFSARAGGGVWQNLCDEALLPFLLVHRVAGRSKLNRLAFVLCGLFAIFALAGPTWERLPTPVFRDQSSLVLLFDLSRSMDALDISPSRLERAKFKITDILRQRPEGQTALIVYAGAPYVVTPLTTDVQTIQSQLPALRTDIMPSQGSNASGAIERGIQLLHQAGSKRGELLMITDGLSTDELSQAARILRDARGIRLSILGVGTTEGAPIPDRNGGFVTDAAGNIALESLKPSELRELAIATGGLYQTVRTDDSDTAVFLNLVDNELNQRGAESTDILADRWREFGPWLLLALLPLAPMGFRRGILSLTIALVISVAVSPEVAVAGWWTTPDQQAQREFDAGNYDAAASTFENQAWRAAAHYRAQDFPAAAKASPTEDDPESFYNQGNALARLGRYEEAIAAYDSALATAPEHEDAMHNKALLEDLLKEQQQEQEQQSEASDDAEQEDSGGQSGAEESDNQSQESSMDSDSTDATQASSGQSEQSESSTSADKQETQEDAAATQAEKTQAESQADESEADAETVAQAQGQAASQTENEQATEQWLRQIPDDPGGLLRRKFEHEYREKHGRRERRGRAW